VAVVVAADVVAAADSADAVASTDAVVVADARVLDAGHADAASGVVAVALVS
jgi:hypothetical protein